MTDVFTAYLEAGKPTRFLLQLVEYWKHTLVSTVKPETIRRAARKIYPDACEATWNRQVLKPTQAAINHASGLGWCQRIAVKTFPENPRKKIPATLEWVRAFCAQAVEDDMPELATLCLFMFGTAARIGEAIRVKWVDLDLMAKRATLYMFKPTPWDRVAHLPADVVAALANIPSNRDPDALVFGYPTTYAVKRSWERTVKRAGIQHLTRHCCRHGFVTMMLRKGFDVKTVAARGGWKDASTVLRTYAHAMEDISGTDAIFDTPVTREPTNKRPTIHKEMKNLDRQLPVEGPDRRGGQSPPLPSAEKPRMAVSRERGRR